MARIAIVGGAHESYSWNGSGKLTLEAARLKHQSGINIHTKAPVHGVEDITAGGEWRTAGTQRARRLPVRRVDAARAPSPAAR